MDVVTPFQFTTQIRAVNPSGIIVGHIMDFTVAGDDHHILNFGTGVLVAERILEGFHLLGAFQIDLSQKLVNRLAILPGETTAATQTLRRRNFFFLRRPRCLTALAPAKACHAGAGAVGLAPMLPTETPAEIPVEPAGEMSAVVEIGGVTGPPAWRAVHP